MKYPAVLVRDVARNHSAIEERQLHLPSRAALELSILILAVVAAAVPFINQPFHMDDNFYIDMARNVLQKPLFPYDSPYVFEGILVSDMGSHSHPPFQAYFLAGILFLFGEGEGRECIYHACALVFPIICVAAFYLLAAKFLRKPLWPALLLAFSPLFLVMQHNLMTDVPNLAFWLSGIAAFVWAEEAGNKKAYLVSSIFLTAALFTSYQSLSLPLLLGFYHLRKRNNAFGWLALLAPVVLLAMWFTANCIHYDRFLLADTAKYVQSRNGWDPGRLATKFAAIIQYQGWLVIFPILLPYVFARGLARRCLVLASLIIAYAVWLAIPQYSLSNKVILIAGSIAGLAIVLEMGSQVITRKSQMATDVKWRTTERQFLYLWYFGVIAYCLLLFSDGSARYLLPLVPPMLMLFCHKCEVFARKAGVTVLYAAVVLSGSAGLALSHADLEFASIYPRIARDSRRITGGMASYYGGEWGFRYYMAKANFRQLTAGTDGLSSSNWLVRPALALPYRLDRSSLARTILVREIAYGVKTPLRLLDRHSPAGFYSTHWGILPFSISWEDQEVIDIRQFKTRAR